MDKKEFSILFIVAFAILTLYLYNNNDDVAQIIANDSFEGVFFYFISNVSYVLIFISIIMFNREVGFVKNTIGSFALLLAIDIVSYPRLLLSSGALTTNIDILASSDALIMRHLLQFGLSYQTAFTFYYLVLPILLIFISLDLLGFHNFRKVITGGQT